METENGTTACPICGFCDPHEHSGLEVHMFRLGRTRVNHTCKRCRGDGSSGFGVCGHCDGCGECYFQCCTKVEIVCESENAATTA